MPNKIQLSNIRNDNQVSILKGFLRDLQWEYPTIIFEFEFFSSKNIGTTTFFGVPCFKVLTTTYCKEKIHNQKLGQSDFLIRRQELKHISKDRLRKRFLLPSVIVAILVASPLFLEEAESLAIEVQLGVWPFAFPEGMIHILEGGFDT